MGGMGDMGGMGRVRGRSEWYGVGTESGTVGGTVVRWYGGTVGRLGGTGNGPVLRPGGTGG